MYNIQYTHTHTPDRSGVDPVFSPLLYYSHDGLVVNRPTVYGYVNNINNTIIIIHVHDETLKNVIV